MHLVHGEGMLDVSGRPREVFHPREKGIWQALAIIIIIIIVMVMDIVIVTIIIIIKIIIITTPD